MSITRISIGMPEAFTPRRFAPPSAAEISEGKQDLLPGLEVRVNERGLRLRFPMEWSTGIYGFGLQMRGFQWRARKLSLRPNMDPPANSGDSHAPVPFFVTTKGYGIYFDTLRHITVYCGKERLDNGDALPQKDGKLSSTDTKELYAPRAGGSHFYMTVEIPIAKGVDLYYISGERILDIVMQYNMLSGGGCLPPLWGLGCQYRCYKNFDAQQALNLAKKLRCDHIPFDMFGLEPGWQDQSYSCSYHWSEERFPHPEQTLREFAKLGYRVSLWEHAFVHPSSALYRPLLPYAGEYTVWFGLVPDFSMPQAEQIYADFHREQFVKNGVAAFKLDECDDSDFCGGWSFPDCADFPGGMDGEQYHSMFGTLYAKTILRALGEKKTFSLVRNLGALAASYPFALYSDLYDHEYYIMATVNSGFSGLLWSPEVRDANNAYYLRRRVQTAVFSAFTLVNAWYLEQTPWDEFDCMEQVRELFRLRMALIPYLYEAYHAYHTTGKPPVRALVCDFEEEEQAREQWDEYLFGDAMLVAPITDENKERDVYLPRGEWIGFFDGKRYPGGVHHIITDEIPVFVKTGSLIPLADAVEHIEEQTRFAVMLHAFGNCRNSVCRLADDDADGTVFCIDSVARGRFGKRYEIVGLKQH